MAHSLALRVALTVGPLLFVVAPVGCSQDREGAPTAGGEAEVKAATQPAKAGGILHFGTYGQQNPGVGEVASLQLTPRTAGMPKKFHGSFVRVDKTASGDKRVEGLFVVKERTTKTSSTSTGKRRTPVLSFFDAKGAKLEDFVTIVLDADIAISKVENDDIESILFLQKTANGQPARGLDVSCDVTSVNQSVNPFEEGLVEKGDGDEDSQVVSIEEVLGKFEVRVGQMRFSQTDGDTIRVERRSGEDVELLIDIGDGDKIRMVLQRKIGTMFIESGASKKDLGEFRCK